MGAPTQAPGPDFSAGIRLEDVPEEGTLGGRVGDEPLLVSRFGGELFAVSGACTHYGAALASGLVDGEAVRCPLHHACFNLRTGAAERTPALDPLDRWRVEVEDGRLFVREKLAPAPASARPASVERVVIVGGGAAGLACANELRRLGHGGAIILLSEDNDAPYDRPNLSKDVLAGTAPAEWLPLRGDDWYAENGIELRLGCEVASLDPAARRVRTAGGEDIPYDRLLLATGSEPNRPRGAGFAAENVFTLRSIADAAAVAAPARPDARAVVIGASFIGLEAAAALRQRQVAVTVVAPGQVPFESLFGAEVGGWFQRLHEQNGVRFQLGASATGIEEGRVELGDGGSLPADFVLLGIGVRPRVALAEAAGLATAAGGVRVDRFLETSVPGVFAAGDLAAYPDPLGDAPMRIEHWVVAERQGQTVAANMLGAAQPFRAVPFFWTEQYGVALRYVGHAAEWDEVAIDGDVASGDFIARYYCQGRHLASAAVGRDRAILDEELRLEGRIAEALSSA